MSFDGGFLHKITNEIKESVDCHIDKIYQPSKDELIFLLRKKSFAKKLLITVKQGSARIQFTETKYENPQTPPNFCMLLRKYLSGAKLVDVMQPGLERLIILVFSTTNEMADVVTLKLICEFIGNKTNIMLIDNDEKIIDSLKHSDPETSDRMILPGAFYSFPKKFKKYNPLSMDYDSVEDLKQSTEKNLYTYLLSNFDGFSPLICREICYRYGSDDFSEFNKNNFYIALDSIIKDLKDNGQPIMLTDFSGNSIDYSYIDILQYSDKYGKKYLENYSALLDSFYSAKELESRIRNSASDIIKLVSSLHSRTEKKLSLRLQELKKCENRETLRLYGELIKANLFSIENGANFAEVQNYYDPELNYIRIPLDPALSPQKNAAKYFKDYKKTYTAQQKLTELTEKDKTDIIYFESVLDNISRSTTLNEISEIRSELEDTGYLKKKPLKRKLNNPSIPFKEYTSEEGYKILVGKNNRQNDLITTNLASKSDLWFHVKNIPGSHVVVFSGGGAVSDKTILYAATLAASNSKASSSSQVPVDYTSVKFVKKPGGAKPGMVIYTTNKTIYVNP